MRGLDWCDNELERTAVEVLLQRLMQTYDTDLRSDPSAATGRDATDLSGRQRRERLVVSRSLGVGHRDTLSFPADDCQRDRDVQCRDSRGRS